MAGSMGLLSVHLGDQVEIGCLTFFDKPYGLPSLVLDAPGVRLTLCPAGLCRVTDQDLETGRALVEAAGAYLAAIEHLHTEQQESGAAAAEGAA